jgi:Zn-finger nucleic acid-binding protein
VKLVACPKCHAQYDVADLHESTVTCRCGTTFPAEVHAAIDAAVTRCAACGALVAETDTVCAYCRAEVTRQAAPAGPVCPECYARNPEQAHYCTACGVAFFAQPVRARGGPLDCPVCPGSPLAARSLGGIWVDECPACLGLWAPGDVMDRLVDRVRARRRRDGPPPASRAQARRHSAWQTDISYRHCPECKGTMQRRNFGHRSGVIIDWCGSHGTWLDANEMEDIAAFVFDGGLENDPAPGGDRKWSLPADPERMAAIAAAERILAEERARAGARNRVGEIDSKRVLRGIGDLFALLLK